MAFPGNSNDADGFALYKDNVVLEDGNTYNAVLQMHPQWVEDGWIIGTYPSVSIMPDTELKILVGFIEGALATDGVKFQVYFKESGATGPSRLLKTVNATYDGRLDSATIPLDSYAGRSGIFKLSVNAGQSSAQDWAVWAKAEITPRNVVVTSDCPLAHAVVGQAYSVQLEAVGGIPPYQWVISDGSLPAGITLNSDTGNISGTPTTSGAWAFRVQAYDSTELDGPLWSDEKDCSIQVVEAEASPLPPAAFDFSLDVFPTDLTMDLAPMISGASGSIETQFSANVSLLSGIGETVALSITGLPSGVGSYCVPPDGLPSLTAQCTLDVTYAALNAGILPSPGAYAITISATGGGITRTRELILNISGEVSGDFEVESVEPVQVVYGAGLVKNKGTVFRVTVISTFSDPIDTHILLDLPDTEWDKSLPASPPRLLPSDWRYPDIWGPIEITPGENIIMLPLIQSGEEAALFDDSVNPAGVIEGSCAALPDGVIGLENCHPDIRVVPRPIGDSIANFTVRIDPHNAIGETSDSNNSLTGATSVVAMKEWRFLVVPYLSQADGCIPLPNFVESGIKNQLEYMLANFPIADTKINYAISLLSNSGPCSPGSPTTCGYATTWHNRDENDEDYEDRGTFLRKVSRAAFAEGFNFGVAMGCGCGGGAGGTDSAVFIGDCSGNDSVVLAHEFNHAVTGMGDIYSLDCLVGWDESYCELPDGTREYCCYEDEREKRDGFEALYCTQAAGSEVSCSAVRTKNCICSCDCSVYDERRDEYSICDSVPVCDAGCCRNTCRANCSSGNVFGGPDGRIRHASSDGFWVNRWITTDDDMNYFMDSNFPTGTHFPHYWMRLGSTTDHCQGTPFWDGYAMLLHSSRFIHPTDPEGLLVSGTVNKDNSVTLDPFIYLGDTELTLNPGNEGNFFFVLKDENGNVLSKSGFDVSFYMPDPDGGLVDETGFVFTIEWIAGTRKIELQDLNGEVLASRVVSENKPSVTVQSPNGGEAIAKGESIHIRWEASDIDGDNLSYSLAMSMNGGESWLPIDIDLTVGEYIIDTTNLEGGQNYLIKVRATDGVNTSEDVSDAVFSIGLVDEMPQKPISTEPVTPEEDYRIYILFGIVALVFLVAAGLMMLVFVYRLGKRKSR